MTLRRPSEWPTSRVSRVLARHDLIGPVVVTGMVLLALVGARLVQYDGDPTGFVQFGHAAAPVVDPPQGSRVASEIGYDGQFFYVHATDPLLRGRAQRALVATDSEFRAQRILYPALAHLAAGGHEPALPWSLLLLNVIAAMAATAVAAMFARSRRQSGWWALAVGLNPGMVLAVLRDLSEPLAVAALIGGLVGWRLRRPGLAAVGLALAVLAREVMLLGVLAVAVEAGWRFLANRDRAVLTRALPACLIPGAVFATWQLYVAERFDGLAAESTPENQFGAPVEGLLDSVERALSDDSLGGAVWDVGFLALVAAAVVIAAVRLRRGLWAPAVAAVCFAGVLLVIDFGGDHWNYTRLAAPLMASLLLAGVDDDDTVSKAVPALAASMTLLIPVAFSAGAGA